MGTVRLETERLILRKFEISDAKGMYENWCTDKEACKFLSWEPHKSIRETKRLIRSWIRGYKHGSYHWIVEIKESGEVIGSISAVELRKKTETAKSDIATAQNSGTRATQLKRSKPLLIFS